MTHSITRMLTCYAGQTYNMYLDDGVSRDSAPRSSFMHSDHTEYKGDLALVADKEARGRYRKVCITQASLSVENRNF